MMDLEQKAIERLQFASETSLTNWAWWMSENPDQLLMSDTQ